MKRVIDKRMAAELEGEFVVFLIGMRINKPWKVHKWFPEFLGMPKMLKELETHPESGFLGHNGMSSCVTVKYWRSFEHLEAYARSKELSHWPAWVDFNRRIGNCLGDVGICHETYLVKRGHYEAIYSAMPPFGLGEVGRMVPASGSRDSAKSRVKVTVLANGLFLIPWREGRTNHPLSRFVGNWRMADQLGAGIIRQDCGVLDG